ncbi:hypothetical protein ACOSQ4_000747 [Xanthoceras sorbifolium]
MSSTSNYLPARKEQLQTNQARDKMMQKTSNSAIAWTGDSNPEEQRRQKPFPAICLRKRVLADGIHSLQKCQRNNRTLDGMLRFQIKRYQDAKEVEDELLAKVEF